jgi:hypothetical protein
MLPLESKLENREFKFVDARGVLGDLGFVLGGGWEYAQGCFDRVLDGGKREMWLRLPFVATHGHIDAEAEENDAVIRFGKPYALRHVHQDGVDEGVGIRLSAGLIDQFAAPKDPDARIPPEWAERAAEMLRVAEAALLRN